LNHLVAANVKNLSTLCTSVGAADKAAIQRVKVPPYQLPVSDT
jgi:hypothetical protein